MAVFLDAPVGRSKPSSRVPAHADQPIKQASNTALFSADSSVTFCALAAYERAA